MWNSWLKMWTYMPNCCFRDATLSLWFVKLPEVATESVNRVARWLSQNYRILTVSMLVAQNIELFTLALSSITIILTPDKGPKYWTARLNTGHLATLNMKYINRPLYLKTWIRHWLRQQSRIYEKNTRQALSPVLSSVQCETEKQPGSPLIWHSECPIDEKDPVSRN